MSRKKSSKENTYFGDKKSSEHNFTLLGRVIMVYHVVFQNLSYPRCFHLLYYITLLTNGTLHTYDDDFIFPVFYADFVSTSSSFIIC